MTYRVFRAESELAIFHNSSSLQPFAHPSLVQAINLACATLRGPVGLRALSDILYPLSPSEVGTELRSLLCIQNFPDIVLHGDVEDFVVDFHYLNFRVTPNRIWILEEVNSKHLESEHIR